MDDKIEVVRSEALDAIAAAQSMDELQQVRIQYLGKKGSIQALMGVMKSLSKEEKPAFGQKVNLCKQEVTDAVAQRQKQLEAKELGRILSAFIATLPADSRLIFLRRYWHLETTEEIAKNYGFSVSKVKTQLHRTRAKLYSYLEKEGIAV
jgi:RNA polymerase sigma factor (sigma-70 family)